MKKQIDILELIPFMKKGWVAMDKNGEWWWFPIEPFMYKQEWIFRGETEEGVRLSGAFNDIAPADDWTKSLIQIKGVK